MIRERRPPGARSTKPWLDTFHRGRPWRRPGHIDRSESIHHQGGALRPGYGSTAPQWAIPASVAVSKAVSLCELQCILPSSSRAASEKPLRLPLPSRTTRCCRPRCDSIDVRPVLAQGAQWRDMAITLDRPAPMLPTNGLEWPLPDKAEVALGSALFFCTNTAPGRIGAAVLDGRSRRVGVEQIALVGGARAAVNTFSRRRHCPTPGLPSATLLSDNSLAEMIVHRGAKAILVPDVSGGQRDASPSVGVPLARFSPFAGRGRYPF